MPEVHSVFVGPPSVGVARGRFDGNPWKTVPGSKLQVAIAQRPDPARFGKGKGGGKGRW